MASDSDNSTMLPPCPAFNHGQQLGMASAQIVREPCRVRVVDLGPVTAHQLNQPLETNPLVARRQPPQRLILDRPPHLEPVGAAPPRELAGPGVGLARHLRRPGRRGGGGGKRPPPPPLPWGGGGRGTF